MGLGLGPFLAWLLGDCKKHFELGNIFELGFLAAGEIKVRELEELILEQMVQAVHRISFWGALEVGAEESGKTLGQHSHVPPHFGVQ